MWLCVFDANDIIVMFPTKVGKYWGICFEYQSMCTKLFVLNVEEDIRIFLAFQQTQQILSKWIGRNMEMICFSVNELNYRIYNECSADEHALFTQQGHLVKLM